jgi:hypothetical protein
LLNGPGMRAHTMRLVQVADGIRFGAANEPPVRFPIQLTGLSPALRVRSVHYVADAGVLRAKEFTLADAGVWAPAFTTGLATPNSSCYFYPGQSRHRRINGYEVMVNDFKARPSVPAQQQVCAADADGLAEFISTFGCEHGFPNAVAVTSVRRQRKASAPVRCRRFPHAESAGGVRESNARSDQMTARRDGVNLCAGPRPFPVVVVIDGATARAGGDLDWPGGSRQSNDSSVARAPRWCNEASADV